MPTDTERLDWYFGQERFHVVPWNGRYELYDSRCKIPDHCDKFDSGREAIDYAMELEPAVEPPVHTGGVER